MDNEKFGTLWNEYLAYINDTPKPLNFMGWLRKQYPESVSMVRLFLVKEIMSDREED